jgi:replicative DNA helicase
MKQEQNKRKSATFELETGRIMPQARELEEAVLSAVMIEKTAFETAGNILKPDMFYDKAHELIFTACAALEADRKPIDLLTVVEQLRKDGYLEACGGVSYIAQLSQKVVSSAHLEYHCLVIKNKYLARRVIEVSLETASLAFDETQDVDETIAKLNSEIERLQEDVVGNHETYHVSSPAENCIEQMFCRIDNIKNGITRGITTGFAELDRITNGWQPEKFIVLAARPGIGKTSIAIHMAKRAARQGVPVAFFSLEMGATELVDRMIISEAGISADNYNSGAIEPPEWSKAETAATAISKFPIYIDDNPKVTVGNIVNKARLLKKQGKCKMAIIDYLQLITPNIKAGRNREQEVSEISRLLKVHAKELKIPFIVLCQMNRDIESEKREPRLSDLRECLPTDEWVYTPAGVMRLKQKPDEIISLDDSVLINTGCSYISKRQNSVYLVKTQYGNFRATAKHPVLTGSGWKQVRDLNPERDVIASAKIIPHANRGYVPHGRLLGWMLGNGCFSGTPALIYRREFDDDVKNEVAKFGVEVKYRKTQKSNNVFDTYLSSGNGCLPNPLMTWIRGLGLENKTCNNKFIPAVYLGSSDETHIDLLRGLWETDGTVTGGKAKYATCSELLARQISWLLLTIGVRSNISLDKNLWTVRCAIADNENMLKIMQNKKRFGRLKMPDTDYIDLCPSIFVELADELIKDSGIRFQKKPNGKYKQISKERMKNIMEKHPIESILNSPYLTENNLGWGRIQSVKLQEGDVNVCDLYVPDSHNFVVNGIIVHNSGSIEQDADIVIFINRLNELRDRQTNELIGENIIELIIRKHRAGKLGKVRIKHNESMTSFYDFDYTGISQTVPVHPTREIKNFYEKEQDTPF